MWLRADGKALRPSYFAALAMFALMMLSKTAFVGLVLTLPLLEWLRGRRLSSGAIVRTAPFLVLGVLQLWLWNRMGGELMTVDPPPPLARPVIAGQALWFYLYKMLWPVGLTTIYPRWDTAVTMIRTIPLALALAGGVAWLIAAFRTSPRRSLLAAAILVGTFQYVVTVGPALGLVPWPHTDVSFVANHFAYVGLAGPIALIVLGARALWRRSRRPSEPLIPAAAVALIVVLLGAVSYWRTRAWYDAPTLANDVLRVNPGCAEALALLSMEAKSEGRPDEAIEKMRQALARKPRYPQALIEYARLLDQYRGQTAEAIEHAGRAAELQPDVANAYWLTAELLEKAGRNAEAVEWADRTLRFPEATPAVVLTLKVRCLRRLGRFEEALAAARSMPQSEPRAQANREQLVAEALIDMGRHEEAIRVLTGLIQRFGPAPASPGARRFAAGAHLVRARALLSLNHPDQAESDLQRAVQLDPSLEPEARRLREAPGP
jgi:tetratricopeptide (TPR) repeat protein